jgi:hypothetical protein
MVLLLPVLLRTLLPVILGPVVALVPATLASVRDKLIAAGVARLKTKVIGKMISQAIYLQENLQ